MIKKVGKKVAIAIFIIAVMTLSCNIGSIFDNLTNPSDKSIKRNVTKRDGGSLALANGAEILIPSGALSFDQEMSLSVLENNPFPEEESFIFVGNTYQIYANEETFSAPIIIILPYNEEDIPDDRSEGEIYVSYYFEGKWRRTYGEVNTEKNIVQVKAYHASIWSVAIDLLSEEPIKLLTRGYRCIETILNPVEVPQNLSEANALVEERLQDWNRAVYEANFEIEELDDALWGQLPKEIAGEIVLHSSEILIEVFAGKAAVLTIGGVAVAEWGGLLLPSIYLFDVSEHSGAVISAIAKLEYAHQNLMAAHAFRYMLQYPDAKTLPDEYLKGLIGICKYNSAVEEKISEVSDLIDVGWGGSTYTVIVVDKSDSMKEYDPSGGTKIEAARQAAKQMVSQLSSGNTSMGTDHQVAVVSFNKNSYLESDFTNNFSQVITAIDNLFPDDGTYISSGFDKANELLSRVSTSGKSFIILMTDGQSSETIDDFRRGPIAVANSRQTCVFTIGFGNDVNRELLQAIANNNVCGKNFQALDAFELSSVYTSAAASTIGQNVQNVNGTVEQGQNVLAGTYEVGPDQGVLFTTLLWEGSTLTTEIYDPNGNVIEIDDYRAEIMNSSPTSQTIRVLAPEEGTWLFRVVGVDVPQSGGERFSLTSSTISMARLQGEEETSTSTTPTSNFQDLFLRPSCGKSYTVDANQPINLSYGAWAAKDEDLIRQTASFIQADLYLDGNHVNGARLSDFIPAPEIPCGDYLEGAYYIVDNAKLDALAVGEHEVVVEFSFTQEITDGYDVNGDGKSDVYGPNNSFRQKYTITSSSSTPVNDLGEWIVVVASGAYSYQSAWDYGQKFVNAGYTVHVFETENNNIRVVVIGFQSEEEANRELPKIQTLNPKAYVRKLSEWCGNRVAYPDHILCK